MKLSFALLAACSASAGAFSVVVPQRPTSSLAAEIRGPTEKAEKLRFGWDGTTALGGAVDNSKPARMLDAIRESGETVPSDCEVGNKNWTPACVVVVCAALSDTPNLVHDQDDDKRPGGVFNANVEMDADSLTFQEVIDMIEANFEDGLIEFKNGDIVNGPGENHGSAKILSYAALSGMDKETTLKLWGEYYREVLADPEGDSHANIRNFQKYGWEGVPFENGIALTPKNTGENDWDAYSESWIP